MGEILSRDPTDGLFHAVHEQDVSRALACLDAGADIRACNLIIPSGEDIRYHFNSSWRRRCSDLTCTATGPFVLHEAAVNQDEAMCAFLLKHNADVNQRSLHCGGDGWMPLHEASRAGSVPICRILLVARAHVNCNSILATPLHCAAQCDHVDACRFLIEKQADIESQPTKCHVGLESEERCATPLGRAVSEGNSRTCKLLLRLKADANVHFSDLLCGWGEGVSPLHVCVQLMEKFISTEYLVICQALLEAAADANHACGEGRTPLHMALACEPVWERNPEVVTIDAYPFSETLKTTFCIDTCRSLIEAKADLLKKNREGQTPVEAAVGSQYYERSLLGIVYTPIRESGETNAVNAFCRSDRVKIHPTAVVPGEHRGQWKAAPSVPKSSSVALVGRATMFAKLVATFQNVQGLQQLVELQTCLLIAFHAWQSVADIFLLERRGLAITCLDPCLVQAFGGIGNKKCVQVWQENMGSALQVVLWKLRVQGLVNAIRLSACQGDNLSRTTLLMDQPQGLQMVFLHSLRYSQDSISKNFRNGQPITDTIEELVSGNLAINDLPRIRVVDNHGLLYTLDNRRLCAMRGAFPERTHYDLRILVEMQSLEDAAVREEFYRKFTAGTSINVRSTDSKSHASSGKRRSKRK